MPDYIYLLENRLSPSQQNALQIIRDAAREAGMTVFLTGGAVRDLTSGSPVRDLDVSVQGNALELKARLQDAGAILWGEHVPSQTLFARFPGSVRVEVSSTRREEFPTLGNPVYYPGSILDDLRRRDFTANAMALSLNEGSYGLLMDPLNGVADLEARLLRLVSNYGFLEDPVRLIRAARLQARLGWDLEEKTKSRFENAKEEGVIAQITPYQQGYEVEEIVHEEDGLKVLKALEAEGWMKALCPAWTSAKADAEQLEAMREVLVQLQMQGVNPDPSAAQAQLLTAKLAPKDVAGLKKLFVRPGFVHEWETQEERAKELAKRLTGKEAATPSVAWKLLTTVDPEALLWLGVTSKNAAVQTKLKDFFTVWPEARQRIPYALMQEMRIVPELAGYQDLVKSIFFELIDGKLTSDEEMRQFLEPHSPPAPPPPVSIRRTRAKKGDKSREIREEVDEEEAASRSAGEDEDGEEDIDGDEDADSAEERAELIPRSLPRVAPPPITEPLSIAPPMSVAPVEKASVPQAAKPVEPPLPALSGKKAEVASKPPAPARKTELAAAPPPVKTLASATPSKAAVPPASKTVAKSIAKVPAKTASKIPAKTAKSVVKTASRPAVKAKSAPKPAGKAKPLAKKAAVKKAAVKPSVKSKLRKVIAKPKPAKVILKSKPAAPKAKPARKAKPVVKAKSSVKAVPTKKKR